LQHKQFRLYLLHMYFFVAWSICSLPHSSTLLKPFHVLCHLAHLCGPRCQMVNRRFGNQTLSKKTVVLLYENRVFRIFQVSASVSDSASCRVTLLLVLIIYWALVRLASVRLLIGSLWWRWQRWVVRASLWRCHGLRGPVGRAQLLRLVSVWVAVPVPGWSEALCAGVSALWRARGLWWCQWWGSLWAMCGVPDVVWCWRPVH